MVIFVLDFCLSLLWKGACIRFQKKFFLFGSEVVVVAPLSKSVVGPTFRMQVERSASFDKQQREFLKLLAPGTFLEMIFPYVCKHIQVHQGAQLLG